MDGLRYVRHARGLRRLLAPLAAGILILVAGCASLVWWGVNVTGSHGRVRWPHPDGGLHDLPASIRQYPIPGTGLYHPDGGEFRLVAVPDCGYAFDAWFVPDWGLVSSDPTLVVGVPLRSLRDVEASFVPTGSGTNDCFTTPQDLTELGRSGSLEFDNLLAGMEEGEPDLGQPVCEAQGYDPSACDRAGASVWWTFRASTAGRLRIEIECELVPACAFAVFSGPSLSRLTLLLGPVADPTSPVDVVLAEGEAIRIMLDGWSPWLGWHEPSASVVARGSTSRGVLRWQFQPSLSGAEAPMR